MPSLGVEVRQEVPFLPKEARDMRAKATLGRGSCDSRSGG